VTRKRKPNATPLLNSPVADIANLLDGLGIPYVFTGSFAYAANKGIARGTIDVDVVVYARSRVKLANLLNALAGAGIAIDPPTALRELDADSLVGIPMPVGVPSPGEPQATFVIEIVLPKVPAVDKEVLERSLLRPYPDRPQGIRVVTLEDYVLFKMIFFREKDKPAIEEALRDTPDLDIDYVMLSLRLVYPPEANECAGSQRWLGSTVS